MFYQREAIIHSHLNFPKENNQLSKQINKTQSYQYLHLLQIEKSKIKMKNSPIKVIIRMRPTSNFAHQQLNIDQQTGNINIHVQKPLDQSIVNHTQNQWGFKFQKVLMNCSQQVVYNLSAKQILTSALDGYSGCILCYGQTGAGKTFTMTGAQNDYKYRGVIPRLLSQLYQQINSRYQHQIKVSISYLQLYNQTLSDLLNENNQNQMTIQEDSKGYVIVKGLSKKQADNQEEALQMLFEGENNRTIAEHKLNKTSSRSHCIFTIHLEIRSKVESAEKVVMSKINLVDLAGSERTKKTGSEGRTLIQAQFINKSLSFLQQVVIALSQKQRDHIPYRQNKLTYLLKDSIGGNSKTCMIANIWPQFNYLQQSISTLKFASRMMKVSNQISVEMNLDPKLLLKKYEKDIRQLKQQLAMHDTLANRGRINYQPYSAEQQHQQQKLAGKFLNGEIDQINIQSLRQVRELFFQFRNIYKSAIKDIANTGSVNLEKVPQDQKQGGEQKSSVNRVGMEQANFGFGAGKAPKDSKPNRNISNLVNIPKQQFQDQTQQPHPSPKKQTLQRKIVNVDKNQAYQDYKSTSGLELNNSILRNIQQLKQKKEEIRVLTEEAQKKKVGLEEIQLQLKHKEENKTQEEINKNIIDQEEFQLIKKKKISKRDYKNQVEKIKALRNIIVELDSNITQLKTALIQGFEAWFFKRYGISVADLDNPLLNEQQKEAGSQQTFSQTPRNEDVDEDALAYIHAKKKVTQIQKARRNERRV